jgi:hypothetical protein
MANAENLSNSVRDDTLRVLLGQAIDAAAKNNFDRSDQLISLILSSDEDTATKNPHEVRMDFL